MIAASYLSAIFHHARSRRTHRIHASFLLISALSLTPLFIPLLVLAVLACAAILLLPSAPLESTAPRQRATLPPTVHNASAMELLLFEWMTPIVSLGRRRPLQSPDIAPLSEWIRSRATGEQLLSLDWARERARAPNPRLSFSLARSFGMQVLYASSLKVLNDVCIFISPLILRQIILVLQNPDRLSGPGGFGLAGLLLLTYAMQSMLFNQYFNIGSMVQVKVRGALVHMIFQKSTRLSAGARAVFTQGNIQNMMSTDSRTVADVVLYINMLWSAMGQILIALVLLIQLLGLLPTSIGVLVMVASIPMESRFVSLTKSLREAASAWTDDRVKVVGEAIQGIKVVKLYAWELSFIERILEKRQSELGLVRKALMVSAWNSTLVSSIPTFLSLAIFTTYALLTTNLDAAVIFPAIALFNILRPPLLIFPYTAVSCARAAASMARVKRFLLADELVSLQSGEHRVTESEFESARSDVIADDASFSWSSSSEAVARPSLARVSLRVPSGALVCVVGGTGCGKSTLLASLLGEVPILSGKAGIRPKRSVSLAEQVPFIKSGTIRDNILFGLPFDLRRYNRVIKVCCLVPDLRILPGGDMTEIGGRGINLSGGQRSRVSMARVAYANADVALLDDPLSAVDAHVGRRMFEDCIVSEMQGKTRILTTNQLQFSTSRQVDYIVVIHEGEVVEFGSRYGLLQDPNSKFTQLITAAGELGRLTDDREGSTDDSNGVHRQVSADDELANGIVLTKKGEDKTKLVDSSASESSLLLSSAEKESKNDAAHLTREEEKNEGRVELKHYLAYMEAAGGLRYILFILFLVIGTQMCSLGMNYWLSVWSEQSQLDIALGATAAHGSMIFHLTVYVCIGVFSIFVTSVSAFSIAFASLRASVTFHERMLFSVFGAPSSWFAANPAGRIVNRFNSDIDKVDNNLASVLQSFTRLSLQLAGALCLILFVTPWFIVAVIPVGIVFLYVQEFYRKSSVDLRRLEAVARSPLYSHFSEILDGVMTIRAFGKVEEESKTNHEYTDSLTRISYIASTANRWLSVRLEGLGTILIFSTAALAVASAGKVSPSLTGLVLSYAMQLLGSMTWSVRTFTDMESQMSAMERIAEFSTSPPFPQEESGGLKVTLQKRAKESERDSIERRGLISPEIASLFNVSAQKRSSWPLRGCVKFNSITMRYRADLPPALRGISLHILPGERIGIVGRTGAGKTSLLSALFRLHEIDSGSIVIDGRDISKISLFDLRSSLSVIPQEPVCFSGTIRTNLDMFGEYDDASVLEALKVCGLESTMPDGVDLGYEIEENGQNLSVGQRQLLCLGRAFLRRSQVLVLDEATSSVSNDTDEKIQSTLRTEFGGCTIITVAHRLHTVMNSDRIVVMEHGEIAEVGQPRLLLENPESMLSLLVGQTGTATAAYLRELTNGVPAEQLIDISTGEPMGNGLKKHALQETGLQERARAAMSELRDVMGEVDSPDWGKTLLNDNMDRGEFLELVHDMASKLYAISKERLGSQHGSRRVGDDAL